MKWLRRSLAFLMVDLLIILLTLALATWQINSTLLRSSYYSEILDRSEAYSFLLTDVPTSALNELQPPDSGGGSLGAGPLELLGIGPEDLVSAINATLPVPWVQQAVEHVISELGGYMTGERDQFLVTVRFGDRVDVLSTEFKSLILRSNAYDLIFDRFVSPLVAETVVGSMPVELDLTEQQVLASVQRITPRDWVEPQFVSAVDIVMPYLTGKTEGFEVVIPLDGRVEVGLQEVKGLLRTSGAYESLYDRLIGPLVYESLGGSIRLPYGILLDDQEIAAALREVAPPEWIQGTAEQIIDDSAPFLMGKSDSFNTTVSLTDIKAKAVLVLEDTVSRELTEIVDSLPNCQNISLQQILASGLQGSIECLPTDSSVRELTRILGDRIASAVSSSIVAVIPESIVFTEQDLYDTLSLAGVQDGSTAVDSIRARVRDGWTYTDEDFVLDLGELVFSEVDGRKALSSINRIRALMSEGWTFSDADFLAYVDSEYPSVAPTLDSVRINLKRSRSLGFLLFAPVVLLIIAIAFVGGRGWSGRFAWAFGSLAGASLVILVMFGIFYGVIVGRVGVNVPHQVLAEAIGGGSFGATRSLIANKLVEMIELVYNDFATGIVNRALPMLALGIFGLVVTLGWDYIAPSLRRFSRGLDLDRIRRR